jgi:hypothetical protein
VSIGHSVARVFEHAVRWQRQPGNTASARGG